MERDDYVIHEFCAFGRSADALEWYRKKFAELKKALDFYANEKNWKSPSTGFALQYDRESSPIERDEGAMARKVLKGIKPVEETKTKNIDGQEMIVISQTEND